MKSILELKGNDYIVCDNIIEAMALEKCLNNNGFTWSSGHKYDAGDDRHIMLSYFANQNTSMGYRINRNGDKRGTHGSVQHFKEEGMKAHYYKDIIELNSFETKQIMDI
jgi:hypothetical protein